MTWEEYYENMWEWTPDTMVQYMSQLTSFGDPEEVMEAIIEISFEDTQGATRMLKKATDYGIKFSGEQLAELDGCCEDAELERAIRFSADQFQDIDIENLYMCYADELVLEIAKLTNLKIPAELLQELAEQNDDEDEDFLQFSNAELVDAYDEVLYCLARAHEGLIMALRFSISDVAGKKRSVSVAKHICIAEAEPFIDEAITILEELESQAKDTLSIQMTRLNLGRFNTFHDVYVDGLLTDLVVQRRLQKMIKAVEEAHAKVKKLKSKLK